MLMCTPADLAVLHTLASLIIQVSPLAVHWPAANSYGGTECNQPVGLDLRSLSTNRKSSALTKSTRWYTASPSAAQVFPRPVLFADTSIVTNSDGDVVASKLRHAAGTAGMSLSVEELYSAPHIHEQMTTSYYGYDNIMLEHNAMNNIDTVAHMNVHNTQY